MVNSISIQVWPFSFGTTFRSPIDSRSRIHNEFIHPFITFIHIHFHVLQSIFTNVLVTNYFHPIFLQFYFVLLKYQKRNFF